MFSKQEERLFEKCQGEVEACENIIKVQPEEKLINGIKKLRNQKEKEDQNKEDVNTLIEEKFDQLEKRLISNLYNRENVTKVQNSFAAAIKGQNVLSNFRKLLRDERVKKLNGVLCQ